MSAEAVRKWGGVVSGVVGTIVASFAYCQSGRALQLSKQTANQAREITVNQLLADAIDRMAGGQGSVFIELTTEERRHVDGELEMARRKIDDALNLDPQNATAHRCRGVYLGLVGRHDEAVTELRKSIELAKDDATAEAQSHNSLGAVLASRKDYEGAIKEFQMATALSPRNSRYLVNLANALAAVGRTTEGRQAIERAQQLDQTIGRSVPQRKEPVPRAKVKKR